MDGIVNSTRATQHGDQTLVHGSAHPTEDIEHRAFLMHGSQQELAATTDDRHGRFVHVPPVSASQPPDLILADRQPRTPAT